MKHLSAALCVLAFLLALPAAQAQEAPFSFGVLGPASAAARDNTHTIQATIFETDADNLAFLVAIGIKGRREPCGNTLYHERRKMLDAAENGVMVTITANDWAVCEGVPRRSGAAERLMQLRELFFNGEFSLGGTRLPVLRQSASPQFRSYVENARWEMGNILFATVNLPANNNNFVSDAGRNSEHEDRQVANRLWLQRLFKIAAYQKMPAIVLFADVNPLNEPPPPKGRDGFADTRKVLKSLASRYSGKVLVISGNAAGVKAGGASARKAPIRPRIKWDGNTGSLELEEGWLKIVADPESRAVLTIGQPQSRSAPDESAATPSARPGLVTR